MFQQFHGSVTQLDGVRLLCCIYRHCQLSADNEAPIAHQSMHVVQYLSSTTATRRALSRTSYNVDEAERHSGLIYSGRSRISWS